MAVPGKKEESLSPPLFTRRQLLMLLWPLIAEELLSVLVGMVDVLMVASVGEATVSGVSLADSINLLVIRVLYALAGGGTVVCARCIGAKDPEGAGKGGAQLTMVTVCSMLALSLFFLVGGRALLGVLFGKVEPAVMADAVVYMHYTTASFPFLALYYAASAVFRAKGNTRISLLLSLAMNALNIAGNAVCIFGLGMGVTGVALPTLLSRAAAAVAILLLLQRRSNDVRIRSLRQLLPDREILRTMLGIGVPTAVENGLFNLGKVLLQSLVSTLGTASIAAYAVAGTLANFLLLPGHALSTGVTTIVGQCYGAKELGQARMYTRKLILTNYVLLAVLCTAMALGRHVWVGFYHLSPEAAALAAALLLAHSFAMAVWPPSFVFPYYFRALGRARFTMVVALFSMAVLRIGLAYLFVKGLHRGVLWVWYAMFADWAFRAIVYTVSFRRDEAGKKPKFL